MILPILVRRSTPSTPPGALPAVGHLGERMGGRLMAEPGGLHERPGGHRRRPDLRGLDSEGVQAGRRGVEDLEQRGGRVAGVLVQCLPCDSFPVVVQLRHILRAYLPKPMPRLICRLRDISSCS